VDLFVKQRPPLWYHSYLPEQWDAAASLQTDKQWATEAEALLLDVEKLSADNRRALEEAARLQDGSITETPLVLRTREVLGKQPVAVRRNLFEIHRSELAQLRSWIDFVIGIGTGDYRELAQLSEELQKMLPEPIDGDAES
jgi:hypothetical protein